MMAKRKKPSPNETPATEPAADEVRAPEPNSAEAAPPAEPQSVDETAQPEASDSEIASMRQDNAQLQDQLLRLRADFDNFRKRMQRERVEMARTANESLLQALLPVVDHMDLALDAIDDAAENPFAEGVRMVREQMLGVLRQFGVAPLQTEGQPFDPHFHDAISHLPSETVPENTVLAQTRRGYLLEDRLLRPAQVVVSSGAPDADPAQISHESKTAVEG